MNVTAQSWRFDRTGTWTTRHRKVRPSSIDSRSSVGSHDRFNVPRTNECRLATTPRVQSEHVRHVVPYGIENLRTRCARYPREYLRRWRHCNGAQVGVTALGASRLNRDERMMSGSWHGNRRRKNVGPTGPQLVGEGGLEPPHPFEYRHLKPARLPISPLAPRPCNITRPI